ncbi:hypothetical protein [Paracidovorax citrulli]|uniref:hypothetical protein n=1 Tax=Paracidovorax citrulli TaxID=80869 RepID=UPI003FA686AD
MRTALAKAKVEWWDALVHRAAALQVMIATTLFPKAAFDRAVRLEIEVEAHYHLRKRRATQRSAKADPFTGLDDEDKAED